jgi:rod shape-determining protein MreC
METILSRHKNVVVLVSALLIQFFLLAVQIRRPTEQGPERLIRILTIRTITPFEKAIVHGHNWLGGTWRNYVYVRGLRAENERLQDENVRLRLGQVRMVQDASQAERLQALLKFKEQFIDSTVAAQVIGTSGTEQSRLLFIDKGSDDGIKPDMAVIAPTGVVGKIVRVQPGTAQVLEINDQTSGIGAILEKSRLQGILKGTPSGDAVLHYIMSDEKVDVGEQVLTSGGDRIFPKGLPVGTVISVNPGSDLFLNIRVKPAAQLNRIEEVLVITKMEDKQPDLTPEGPQRAADILAARLPSIPVKPPDATAQTEGANAQQQPGPPAQTHATPKPQPAGATQTKPQTGTVKPQLTGTKTVTTMPKPQNTESTQGMGTAATKPQPVSAKPATGAGLSVHINGQGVKHVSDTINGNRPTPAKPTAKPSGAKTQQQ